MFTIDRASWILLTVVGALLLALWALFNRPDHVPPWPETIQGVAFSPFRADQDPIRIDYPSEREIERDLKLLSGTMRAVRTYSVEGTLESVPRLARPLGLNVIVGVWISSDLERNRLEIEKLREIRPEFGRAVKGIVVGNEALLRKELEPAEMIPYLEEIRRIVAPIPVTVAETWDVWHRHPELAEHVDFVTAHILPYWEGVPASRAPDYVFERYEELRERFPDKRVLIGEVGWPSEGRQRGGAIPSLRNQAKFLRQFLAGVEENEAEYFLLEAFDQVWKTDEGAVGRYWGIYDAEREPKFPFSAPVTPVPEWPALAGFSLAFTILLLTLLLRDSRGLVHGGARLPRARLLRDLDRRGLARLRVLAEVPYLGASGRRHRHPRGRLLHHRGHARRSPRMGRVGLGTPPGRAEERPDAPVAHPQGIDPRADPRRAAGHGHRDARRPCAGSITPTTK